MTCPRTMKWQGEGATTLESFELARGLGIIILEKAELRKEVLCALEARHELIAEDYRDDGELKATNDASLSYYIAIALESWTDGEPAMFHDELMERMLQSVPAQELVLLQRMRNGCPLLKRYISPGPDGRKLD